MRKELVASNTQGNQCDSTTAYNIISYLDFETQPENFFFRELKLLWIIKLEAASIKDIVIVALGTVEQKLLFSRLQNNQNQRFKITLFRVSTLSE